MMAPRSRPKKRNLGPRSLVGKRPYIGMHFKCCNVYVRIYLNTQGTAYVGHCPKCTAKTKIKVSPVGKSDRFWSSE